MLVLEKGKFGRMRDEYGIGEQSRELIYLKTNEISNTRESPLPFGLTRTGMPSRSGRQIYRQGQY